MLVSNAIRSEARVHMFVAEFTGLPCDRRPRNI